MSSNSSNSSNSSPPVREAFVPLTSELVFGDFGTNEMLTTEVVRDLVLHGVNSVLRHLHSRPPTTPTSPPPREMAVTVHTNPVTQILDLRESKDKINSFLHECVFGLADPMLTPPTTERFLAVTFPHLTEVKRKRELTSHVSSLYTHARHQK